MTQDFSQLAGTLAAGDQIAGYQIGGQIGAGGMAVVYRALDLRLGRQVALKVLAARLAEDDAFRQRFIRESRAAAGVDHPHIVPVFEAGEAGGVLFIAMRYVSAGDVRTLIQSEGTLSPARASAIASQAASALDAAHAHGLVHRDVKPGNILLDAVGGRDHVYLADFGLSKHSLAATTLTAAGQFMGTLDYVSPEQIQGHPADGRADQYALACTVVEMLSGTPPYKRDESMALLWAQLEAPPPVLTELRPDLPPELNAVISKALSKSPNDRYPTCLAFASALAAACEAKPAVLRDPTELAAALPAEAVTPAAERPGWTDDTRPEPIPAAQPAGAAPAAFAAAQAGTPTSADPQAASAAPFAPPQASATPLAAPQASATPLAAPQASAAPFAPPLAERQPRPGTGNGGGAQRQDAVAGRQPQPWAGTGADRQAQPWPGTGAGRDRQDPGWPRPPENRPKRDQHLVPQRQAAPRRTGRRVTAAFLGVVIVAGLGFAGYKLLSRPANGTSVPPVYVTRTVTPSPGTPVATLTPAGTVQAYFGAINAQNYERAWQLNTVVHSNEDYDQFVSGLAGTARDTVTIQSTTGDIVTAQLVANQTNGTVKKFQGTYTVTDGIISASSIHQVSSS